MMALVVSVRPILHPHPHHHNVWAYPTPNFTQIACLPRYHPGSLKLLPFKGPQLADFNFQNGRQQAYTAGRRLVVGAVLVDEKATPACQADVGSLRTELLGVVAGLDRGLSASEADVEAADTAARQLEAAGTAVEFPEDLDRLQGRWRLIYSSAFASGSLGGRRPGPPVGRLPLNLGQVYQRIDVVSRELDNIVDLRLGTPWPLPPLEVTATLAHTFELTGGAGIKIIFEKSSVKPGGSLSQLPPFSLPQLPEFLRPPSGVRSGDFQTTYLDKDLRVTRGDRGELRIFLRS